MDQRQHRQTHFSGKHHAFQSAKELPLVNSGCDLAERNLRAERSLMIGRAEGVAGCRQLEDRSCQSH